MARVLEHELERVVDLRAHPVVAMGHLGERARDVPRREARRDRAEPLLLRREIADQTREELGLARGRALLGVGQLVGERVEVVAREALAGRDRLLAPPRGGRLVDVRARHLDVPAEDAGVSELQAGDARRLAQPAPRAPR